MRAIAMKPEPRMARPPGSGRDVIKLKVGMAPCNEHLTGQSAHIRSHYKSVAYAVSLTAEARYLGRIVERSCRRFPTPDPHLTANRQAKLARSGRPGAVRAHEE